MLRYLLNKDGSRSVEDDEKHADVSSLLSSRFLSICPSISLFSVSFSSEVFIAFCLSFHLSLPPRLSDVLSDKKWQPYQ